MKVQVRDRLTAVTPNVRDDSVTVRAESFRCGNAACHGHQVRQQPLIDRIQRSQRVDVLFRDAEEVDRCLGVDVAESEHVVVLIENISRYLFAGDATE
jgi:hypothetical protein